MIITAEILAAFMIFLGTLGGSSESYSTDINDYDIQVEESDTSSQRKGRMTFKAKEGATLAR